MKLTVACVQPSPGNELDANLDAARVLVERAARQGAQLVALPEFAAFLDRSGRAMAAAARPEATHPALERFCGMARRHCLWLAVGSIVVRDETADDDEPGRLSNRSFLIAPDGTVAARYDKIHMFDAVLSDGRSINESRAYRPGRSAVVADTPWGPLGLSICYDLRFPQLYRALAQAGAGILMVPSAFAHETGAAHWEPLLRARAIENGSFVVAAATCGTHPGDWRTWGHSMIVDPWGRILAQADDQPGVITAELDLDAITRARSAIPAYAGQQTFDIVRAHPIATSLTERTPS